MTHKPAIPGPPYECCAIFGPETLAHCHQQSFGSRGSYGPSWSAFPAAISASASSQIWPPQAKPARRWITWTRWHWRKALVSSTKIRWSLPRRISSGRLRMIKMSWSCWAASRWVCCIIQYLFWHFLHRRKGIIPCRNVMVCSDIKRFLYGSQWWGPSSIDWLIDWLIGV